MPTADPGIIDSIITPIWNLLWPHLKIVLIIIGITYGLKKTLQILFKVDIKNRILSAIPLVIGMLYFEFWVVQAFSPWKDVVKTLVGGLIYGALATSLYDMVLDKVVILVDKIVDGIIAKIKGNPPAPPVEPPKP